MVRESAAGVVGRHLAERGLATDDLEITASFDPASDVDRRIAHVRRSIRSFSVRAPLSETDALMRLSPYFWGCMARRSSVWRGFHRRGLQRAIQAHLTPTRTGP
jgi:hypothetical protein